MNARNNELIQLNNVVMDFQLGSSGLFKKNHMRALNDISLSLKKGKALALVGESGSGKSTCARIIARMHEATDGSVLFRGKNINEINSKEEILRYKKSVQMIFQDPFGSLNPTHTIGYHLERPLLIHNQVMNKKELKEKIHELLETVGLTPAAQTAGKFPHEISGGQRQRVAIARVLAVDPEIILADEPTSMLDVSIRIGILNLMNDLKEKKRLSFLYITHDIATARYFADDTAVMYAGHIVEWGESDNITGNPQHPYTQLLIDSVPNPVKNFKPTITTNKKGEIPLWKPESRGCPFASRCPSVKPVCHEKMPNVTRLSENQYTRCFLFS